MGWEAVTEVPTDAIQHELVEIERHKSAGLARELELLEELDRRQTHTADGCRSLGEWVALATDTTVEDAKSMVRTMRRTVDRPDLREALASGVSFRRVEALSKISEDIGLGMEFDVAGLHRESSRKARLTAVEEARTVDDQFLVMQPNLDRSWFKLWGGVDGYTGEVLDQTLNTVADGLPDPPEDHGYLGSSWKRAQALLALCMGTEAPRSDVSVFITTREAAETGGESGVVLGSGAKVGRRALEAILCGAPVQVFGITQQGEYMRYGRRYRFATPSQTKALMHKYRGRCAADGCNSRNRLQAHHADHWAVHRGETNTEDMVLLCWFHHHVVVHQWGYQIYHHPDHGRIRFRRPRSRAP